MAPWFWNPLQIVLPHLWVNLNNMMTIFCEKVFELNLKSAKNCVFLPLELSLTFAEDPTHIVKIKWFVIQREIGANYFTWHDRDERSSSLGVLIPLELLEDFNVCWIISGNSSVWEEDSQTLEMKEMSCPDSLRWTFLSWQVIFKSKMWKCEDEVQQSLLM